MTETHWPRFIALPGSAGPTAAEEAAAGLRATPSALPPKFFYDELGSRLFDAITLLDEYYPTRQEAALMQRHAPEIAAAIVRLLGSGATLIDLGAGDGTKAARLFPLLQPQRYVAVDISTVHLQAALTRLQHAHPRIAMTGVGLDFARALLLPEELVPAPALVFYPGSSIGNFEPAAARQLLRQARAASRRGALLIGVDLVKPAAVLDAAYDDALGVTAAFNRNLLRSVNRLLEADFVPSAWRHVAFFDAEASRVEMHLQAERELTVRWHVAGGGERRYAAGERIHTENSYKWRPDAFEELLREAGFSQVQCWTDAQRWFAVMLASG